jgi:hypothetical protein
MNSRSKINMRNGLAAGTVLLALFVFSAGAALSNAQDEAVEDATAPLPAMLPTSITAGSIDPAGKVPAIDGVPGSKVTNVDVAFPLGLLKHGTEYVYSFTIQDNNYTGSCTASYSLTQVQDGKTVTLESADFKTFTTKPGNYWFWVGTGKAIPDSPGLAKLNGIVKCGTSTNTISSTVLLQ